MTNPAALLFGPLAGPECRRASIRGWPIWVRVAAGAAAMTVALATLWFAWFSTRVGVQDLSLFRMAPGALVVVEGMAITLALVLSPAVLAGSLAGERERGTIGLLLITRMTAREIAAGRLASGLAQVGSILLAMLPALVLCGMLSGLGLADLLALAALPAALAVGGGGVALAASVLSKRGRDALLVVYLLDLLFLLSPLLRLVGTPPAAAGLLAALNPYAAVGPLSWYADTAPAWRTVSLWLLFGLGGLTVATVRLPRSCLGPDGTRGRRRAVRRWWVPALDDRPMLWKELYIERADSLGRAAQWIGLALVVFLAGGSLALAAACGWFLWVQPDDAWLGWTRSLMAVAFDRPAWLIAYLLEWAIGLRAAVAVASERERGSWEALLTSPLTGREIILGKLWGSLFALRWLAGSALLAWTLATICGAMAAGEYLALVTSTAVVGSYMAAAGVRASLAASTATRSMAITMGLWLLGVGVIAVASGALCLLLFWLNMLLLQLTGSGASPAVTILSPRTMTTAWSICYDVLFALTALAIAAETALRFDRIAGRMTEGASAQAVDRLVHGEPVEPVWVGPRPGSTDAAPQPAQAAGVTERV